MKVVSFFFPDAHFVNLTLQYSLVQRKLLHCYKLESLKSHASFFFKQSLALIESLIVPKYDDQRKKKSIKS